MKNDDFQVSQSQIGLWRTDATYFKPSICFNVGLNRKVNTQNVTLIYLFTFHIINNVFLKRFKNI